MDRIYKRYNEQLREGEEWKKEKPLSDDEVMGLIEVFVDFQNLPSHDERGRLIEKLGVALNHYLQIKDD